MLIRVDFFKSTGKWYAGGRVEIDSMPWEHGIRKGIVENQRILVDNWYRQEEFFVVVSDIPESDNDPNYRMTYLRLYKPEDFRGL